LRLRVEIRRSRPWPGYGHRYRWRYRNDNDGSHRSPITDHRSRGAGLRSAVGRRWQFFIPRHSTPDTRHSFSVTSVVLQSLGAQTDGQAVVVTWKTGNEVNNLGFHVYREEHGRLVRVTKEVLPGSALQTGTVALASGHSYSFVDPTKHEEPGTRNYYVEDIDLNGTKTLHGPVVPVVTERPLASAQGRTLSGLRGEAAKREKRPPAVLKGRTSAASGRHTQPFPYALSSPEETQQALAASAAIKVYVQEDGWYRVALSDLAQAGWMWEHRDSLRSTMRGKRYPYSSGTVPSSSTDAGSRVPLPIRPSTGSSMAVSRASASSRSGAGVRPGHRTTCPYGDPHGTFHLLCRPQER